VSDERPVDWPDVDVVMPVRDEADHLAAAVAAVRAQDYPGRVGIVLGVAPSGDGTEALAARIATAVSDVVVVPNPAGTTPAGLDAAIRAGDAPVVARVDGHSRLPPGYLRRAVETLQRTGAVNVGGRQVPRPASPFEAAVAAATTSWLGTGGASYRTGGEEGPVDTVYLGVFDRAAIEQVGLFDERLIRNQDYELNIRLRGAGGVVWFDPELWVGYRPRGTWRALARQYFEYGRWKATVIRLHPAATRPRQLLPPAAVGCLAGSVLLGFVRRRFFAPVAVYAAAVGATAARSAGTPGVRARTLFVTPTIHVAWSIGLLAGVLSPPIRSRGDDPAG
jgi:glycosyltransferase involved in cell wall biosynthesis